MEALASHPLVPPGLSPETVGKLLTLRSLLEKQELLEHRYVSEREKPDEVLVQHSIQECRSRVREALSDAFPAGALVSFGGEDTDEWEVRWDIAIDDAIDYFAERIADVANECQYIQSVRENVCASRAPSVGELLNLPSGSKRSSIILLEEMATLRRQYEQLWDLSGIMTADASRKKRPAPLQAHVYRCESDFPSAWYRTRFQKLTTLLAYEWNEGMEEAFDDAQQLADAAFYNRYPSAQFSLTRAIRLRFILRFDRLIEECHPAMLRSLLKRMRDFLASQ